MNEQTAKYRWLPISNLRPAAARLLLALFTLQPHEPEVLAMRRSGIANVETYTAAYELLEARGFIVWRDGQRYITLYAEAPAQLTHERVSYPATTTMITKAKLPQ